MNKAIYALCAIAYAAIHAWAWHGGGGSAEARQAPPIAPQMDIRQKVKKVSTTRAVVNEPIKTDWEQWG